MKFNLDTDGKTEYKKGKAGEERFIRWLKSENIPFKDVRNWPEYQKKDIDFIIAEKGFEVKTNYHLWEYGNIYLERYYDIYRNGKMERIKGGWETMEAEYLIIIDGHLEKGYRIRIHELRDFVKKTKPRTKISEFMDGNLKKTYSSYVVRLQDLIDEDMVYEFKVKL